MDVHEHRVLTALLRWERTGVDPLFIALIEKEAYPGHIGELEVRGLVKRYHTDGRGFMVGLTETGRQIAESLPEKWPDAN